MSDALTRQIEKLEKELADMKKAAGQPNIGKKNKKVLEGVIRKKEDELKRAQQKALSTEAPKDPTFREYLEDSTPSNPKKNEKFFDYQAPQKPKKKKKLEGPSYNPQPSAQRQWDVAKGGMIKKAKMMGGGMYKKPQMMHGGTHKGKQHSYVAGGSVKNMSKVAK